jgi:hypothetical protein
LSYHHVALTILRGVKEMNGTGIEAHHARKFSASPWSPGAVAQKEIMENWANLCVCPYESGQTHRSAPASAFGRQPGEAIRFTRLLMAVALCEILYPFNIANTIWRLCSWPSGL